MALGTIWVHNKIDISLFYERLNNIVCAAQAMVEFKVSEKQVVKMLIKYWNLRPSDATEFYQYAVKQLSHDSV